MIIQNIYLRNNFRNSARGSVREELDVDNKEIFYISKDLSYKSYDYFLYNNRLYAVHKNLKHYVRLQYEC